MEKKVSISGLFPEEIANAIQLSPSFRAKQIYEWISKGAESFEQMTNIDKATRKFLEEKFSQGFFIPHEKNEREFISRPATLEWNNENSCRLTITEGKFHQVKRMFSAQGNKVVFLKRISIGSLALDENLAPGDSRELSSEELSLLFK